MSSIQKQLLTWYSISLSFQKVLYINKYFVISSFSNTPNIPFMKQQTAWWTQHSHKQPYAQPSALQMLPPCRQVKT